MLFFTLFLALVFRRMVLVSKFQQSDSGKLPISCFIIAKNEAHRIARCIESVIDWADEVIVVEAGSHDDTIKIAENAGAKVLHNEWEGFGQQKRFAEDQCRNTWVLNLDADEEATPALRSELAEIFKSGDPAFAAYALYVQIVYPGWQRPRLWARDHKCIRFYDRSRVRFRNSTIHDSVDPGANPVGWLSSVLWHHTFTSIPDLIAKCDERATFGALHSTQRSVAKLRIRSAIEWPFVFLKYYFFRRHFTGGRIGLRYCVVMARYRRQRILRMLAKTAVAGKADIGDPEVGGDERSCERSCSTRGHSQAAVGRGHQLPTQTYMVPAIVVALPPLAWALFWLQAQW